MTQTEQPPVSSGVGKWKAYPAYRDSGVEWLGEIPEHWEAKKIKRFCQVKRGASPRPIDDPIYFDEEGEYAWVRISDVTASARYLLKTEQRLSPLGQSKSICLEPGELFLSIAGTVGKPIITQIKCCIHDGFVYFTHLHENKEYLFYMFSGGELYKGLGKLGTQLNLNTDTIGDIRVPIPSLSEQHAITTFLNRETTQINTLIAKKERLIELLQEKRAALISHAVTKGLDAGVKMKDSDVEWLGEIPEHWEVLPLKRVARIRYGLGQPPTQIDEGIPFVRATNVKSGVIENEEMLYVDSTDVPQSRDAVLRQGEIIVVRSGANTGDSAIVPKKYEGAIAGYDMVVTLTKEYSPFFAWQLLTKEVRDLQFGFYSLRAAQAHLNTEELGSTLFVVPSFTEQQTIATYLDHETSKIDGLVSIIREGIEKLKEYSTALISAAVTGKIDIRGEITSMDDTD